MQCALCIVNIFNRFGVVAGDSRFNQVLKVHSRVSSQHKYAIFLSIFCNKTVSYFPQKHNKLSLALSFSISLSLSLWFAHKALAFLTASLLHFNTSSYSGIWHIQLHTATFSISGKWPKRSPNRGHHVTCLLVCLFVHKYHFLKMEIGKDHYLGPTWIGKTRSKAMDFQFKSCSMHRKQTFW